MPPAGLVLPLGAVESVGGGVVVVVVLLLVVELVGGPVVVVGGAVVVGGRVVLGGRRAGRLDDGAGVVVVARLPCGMVTRWRLVVLGGLVEVAWETASRGGRAVVVVPWAVATVPGLVSKPTTLPPIAPISIAVTTLTQRRSATKEIGPKLGPPRFELPDSDDKRHRPAPLEHLRTDTSPGALPPPHGTMGAAAGAASAGASRRAS